MAARRTSTADPALALIDAYAAAIVQAHDERTAGQAPSDEAERERGAVVTLAANIAERLRCEHHARQAQ